MGSMQEDPTLSIPPAVSQTQVLIIGGGPTGLTSAILLAGYGICTTVVERHHERLGQPKAHAINPRALEILKQLGLDTDHLRRLGMSAEEGDMVRFAESMNGIVFGSVPYERQTDEARTITPEPLFNIPQPALEEFLHGSAQKNELITVWKGVQFERCLGSQSDRQTSLLLHRKTGRTVEVQSKYILACDGASSRSREKFHVPFSTLPGHPDRMLNHVSIHINADLSKFRTGTLWFFIGPHQQGTLIAYDRRCSWVYVPNLDPEHASQNTATENQCRRLVDQAIGESISYDILSITRWTTNPKAADTYRSKSNPAVFLVGDAAHAFPPTGGLGVNTGIADAHNLAWKIHAVEKGWAPGEFLDSYGHERRPVAIANARQSALNQKKLGQLMKLTSRPDLANVDEAIADPKARRQILDAIHENRDHFDSIGLQIGYVYGAEDSLADAPCDHYQPQCISGVRLPHAWIFRNGSRCSTLDLVDGKSFIILAQREFEIGRETVCDMEKGGAPIEVLRAGEDFVDEEGTWLEVMQLTSSGSGVLIRPDQHIVGHMESLAEAEDMVTRLFQAV